MNTRVIAVGDGINIMTQIERVNFTTLEQISKQLQDVALRQIGNQERMGNEVSRTEIDYSSFKPIKEARRSIVAYFDNNQLAKEAMLTVERVLRQAIDQATDVDTGRLRNIQSSWQWTLVRGYSSDKRRPGGPVTPSSIDSLGGIGYSDRLVLKPKSVFYATMVNSLVAGGNKSLSIKTRGKYGKKGTADFLSKRYSEMGFMGYAAQTIKRIPAIRQSFSVYAAFTHRFAVSGELVTKQGTAILILRPKRKGRLSR